MWVFLIIPVYIPAVVRKPGLKIIRFQNFKHLYLILEQTKLKGVPL